MKKDIIKEIREKLPADFNITWDITFDEPEDVLLWLEELVRYDIVRLSKFMPDEDELNNELTRLNSEITKRLEKVIKLKRTKAEKGKLSWEDL